MRMMKMKFLLSVILVALTLVNQSYSEEELKDIEQNEGISETYGGEANGNSDGLNSPLLSVINDSNRPENPFAVKEKRCPSNRLGASLNPNSVSTDDRKRNTLYETFCKTCLARNKCDLITDCPLCEKWCSVASKQCTETEPEDSPNEESKPEDVKPPEETVSLANRGGFEENNIEKSNINTITLNRGSLMEIILHLLGVWETKDVESMTITVKTVGDKSIELRKFEGKSGTKDGKLVEKVQVLKDAINEKLQLHKEKGLDREELDRLVSEVLSKIRSKDNPDSSLVGSPKNDDTKLESRFRDPELKNVMHQSDVNPDVIEDTPDMSKMTDQRVRENTDLERKEEEPIIGEPKEPEETPSLTEQQKFLTKTELTPNPTIGSSPIEMSESNNFEPKTGEAETGAVSGVMPLLQKMRNTNFNPNMRPGQAMQRLQASPNQNLQFTDTNRATGGEIGEVPRNHFMEPENQRSNEPQFTGSQLQTPSDPTISSPHIMRPNSNHHNQNHNREMSPNFHPSQHIPGHNFIPQHSHHPNSGRPSQFQLRPGQNGFPPSNFNSELPPKFPPSHHRPNLNQFSGPFSSPRSSENGEFNPDPNGVFNHFSQPSTAPQSGNLMLENRFDDRGGDNEIADQESTDSEGNPGARTPHLHHHQHNSPIHINPHHVHHHNPGNPTHLLPKINPMDVIKSRSEGVGMPEPIENQNSENGDSELNKLDTRGSQDDTQNLRNRNSGDGASGLVNLVTSQDGQEAVESGSVPKGTLGAKTSEIIKKLKEKQDETIQRLAAQKQILESARENVLGVVKSISGTSGGDNPQKSSPISQSVGSKVPGNIENSVGSNSFHESTDKLTNLPDENNFLGNKFFGIGQRNTGDETLGSQPLESSWERTQSDNYQPQQPWPNSNKNFNEDTQRLGVSPDINTRGEFDAAQSKSNSLGSIIPGDKEVDISFKKPSDVYFIGNGIKLPLQMVRKSDGAVHFSVDMDKLCACNNTSCPRNQTAGNLERTVETILEKEAELKDQLKGSDDYENDSLGAPYPGFNDFDDRDQADNKFIGMKNRIANNFDSAEMQGSNGFMLKRSVDGSKMDNDFNEKRDKTKKLTDFFKDFMEKGIENLKKSIKDTKTLTNRLPESSLNKSANIKPPKTSFSTKSKEIDENIIPVSRTYKFRGLEDKLIKKMDNIEKSVDNYSKIDDNIFEKESDFLNKFNEDPLIRKEVELVGDVLGFFKKLAVASTKVKTE